MVSNPDVWYSEGALLPSVPIHFFIARFIRVVIGLISRAKMLSSPQFSGGSATRVDFFSESMAGDRRERFSIDFVSLIV